MVGIVSWGAWSAENELDVVTVRPVVQGLRRELWATVHLETFGQPASGFQSVQRGHHPCGREGPIDYDRRTLTTHMID